MPGMATFLKSVRKKLGKLKSHSHGEYDTTAAENAALIEPDKPEAEQKQQDGNLLMRLPPELRDKIYFYLFSSTRFMYGQRFTLGQKYNAGQAYTRLSNLEPQNFIPPLHGLALLRSFRQVHLEISKAWLDHVIFCFECPSAMLRQLSKLPLDTRALIRHVRIASDALQVPLSSLEEKEAIKDCFKLLLKMNLNTLTVFGPAIPCWSHEDLNLLIKYGKGWKELRYITRTSAFVDTISSDSGNAIALPCKPQAAAWQRDLEDRDGLISGASVTMYKSTDSNNPLSVMCSTMRTELSYPPTPTTGVDYLEADGNSQSLDLKEDKRGILIVVKRGENADWQGVQRADDQEDEESLDFPWVRTKDATELTTQDVQRLYTTYDISTIDFRKDDLRPIAKMYFNDIVDHGSNMIVVDNYKHVDDYAFPPHSFRTEQIDLFPFGQPRRKPRLSIVRYI